MRTHKLHIRVDDINPAHVTFSVFMNGRHCGRLCMGVDEYKDFARHLVAASPNASTGSEFEITADLPEESLEHVEPDSEHH